MKRDRIHAIEIQLTKGQVALISVEDADLAMLHWYAAFSSHYSGDGAYHAARTEKDCNGKQYTKRMHRVILARILGREMVCGEIVDHIDGNPLNNVRGNLRMASGAQNAHNQGRQKHNTSGYKGVFWHKQRQRWRAQCMVNGKRYSLGLFEDPEDAARAYDNFAQKHHGDFARLNFTTQ